MDLFLKCFQSLKLSVRKFFSIPSEIICLLLLEETRELLFEGLEIR